MANVNSNICLDEELWKRCKKTCVDRRISLNQLVKDGLHLALGDSDVIKVDGKGNVSNDLRGAFPKKSKPSKSRS